QQYFAPETLHMAPLGSRTDIYNLGVLFYHVLTGQLPFNDDDGSLYPPSKYNPHIPFQLDRIVLKMINGKPMKRYQRIGPIVGELSRMIGRNESNPHADLQLYGSKHLLPSEFTGREAEVKTLDDFYHRMMHGQGGTMLITGKRGVGRKRIILQVAGKYLRKVSTIMAMPKGKALSVAEQFVLILLKASLASHDLENIGRAYLPRLAKVFPRVAYEYKQMLADTAEPIKELGLNELVQEFVFQVIYAMGEPVIFYVDEANLADIESLRLLKNLCLFEKMPISLVGIVEQETPELAELFTERLDVEPMPLDDLCECVLSRFGDANFLTPSFMQWLNYHAEGSVGRAFQILEYLADSKQVYLQRDVWHLAAASVEGLSVPESDDQLMLYPLDLLPPAAVDILKVMSMFQGPLLIDAIAKSCNMEDGKIFPMLHLLEERGLLMHSQNRYRLPSHTLRTHLYESMPPETRTLLHRELAAGLVAAGSNDHAEIAHHFEKGMAYDRALLYHILAARRAFTQSMLAECETEIHRALAMYDHLPGRVPPRALQKFLARVLEQSGNIHGALDIYSDLFEETGQTGVMIDMLNCHTALQQYTKIEPYVSKCRDLLQTHRETLSPKHHINLMRLLGMYAVEVANDYDFVLELNDYQRTRGSELRRTARIQDYIRWLTTLQSLLKRVPNAPQEQRMRYLYEAATLSEHYNLKRQQALLYISLGVNNHEHNPQKAKEYYLRSLKMLTEVGDKHNQMLIYYNLIDAYRLLGDIAHAYRYLEIASDQSPALPPFLIQQQADMMLFVENYAQADLALKKLAQVAKQDYQNTMRQRAFLQRFQMIVGQRNERGADRLWPAVERLLQGRNDNGEFKWMRAQYDLLKRRYAKVIDDLWPVGKAGVSNEYRIRQELVLLEALQNIGRVQEAVAIAEELLSFIHSIGYYGHLAWVHLHLGRLYQLTGQFVASSLSYKHAMMWFRKLNHQSRLLEVEKLINETDRAMISIADTLTAAFAEEEAATASAVTAPNQNVGFRRWVRSIVQERHDAIDTLAEREIVLDAVRRISSSILVQQVCEQLANVMFENILIDHIHLLIRIDERRDERIHLDVQLQPLVTISEAVESAFQRVLQRGEAHEWTTADTHLYALPIFSHDQQVIAVIVLEKLSNQSAFTDKELRFLNGITQLVSSNIENAILYEAMITDNLTGLYTRNYFNKRIQEEFAKVKRYGIDLSFLMIDLDDFRIVNNTFGHTEGDRVLHTVAQTLRKSVRNIDIVGRFGGEELIVILPNTNGAGAKNVAERLLQNLRAIPIEGNQYRITASIGVAAVDTDHPVDSDDLLEMADQAELHAKRTGKNRVVCHWDIAKTDKDPIT
ncbi:MAG: diguanylate cyclase, partial [Tumebacillaceae bacterium]